MSHEVNRKPSAEQVRAAMELMKMPSGAPPVTSDSERIGRAPSVLRAYAKDIEKHGRPLDSGLPSLLKFVADWIEAPFKTDLAALAAAQRLDAQTQAPEGGEPVAEDARRYRALKAAMDSCNEGPMTVALADDGFVQLEDLDGVLDQIAEDFEVPTPHAAVAPRVDAEPVAWAISALEELAQRPLDEGWRQGIKNVAANLRKEFHPPAAVEQSDEADREAFNIWHEDKWPAGDSECRGRLPWELRLEGWQAALAHARKGNQG